MPDLDLHSDEYVVMKAEGVRYTGRPAPSNGGAVGSYNKDLVLTNRRIILITKSMFGKTKDTKCFSVRDIKNIDGKPQAIAAGAELELYLSSGQEYFTFGSSRKKEVKEWAHHLSNLLTGSSEPFSGGKEKALPGSAYVAETLRDTVDTFKLAFGRKVNPSKPESRARQCTSCGASISGLAGQVVRCQHCDMTQQL